MSFIEQVRTSETDEWYTSEDTVEIIVPYLIRGGASQDIMPVGHRKVSVRKSVDKIRF